MARELHHRKKDNKYALWSTIVDDYVTEWEDKEEIRKQWYLDKFKSAMKDVDKWMEEIDKEVWKELIILSKEEIRSIGLIAIVIFLFGIIIGFTFMYQLRVQAEKRCEVLQEEVNLLKEVIIKEQK